MCVCVCVCVCVFVSCSGLGVSYWRSCARACVCVCLSVSHNVVGKLDHNECTVSHSLLLAFLCYVCDCEAHCDFDILRFSDSGDCLAHGSCGSHSPRYRWKVSFSDFYLSCVCCEGSHAHHECQIFRITLAAACYYVCFARSLAAYGSNENKYSYHC